MKSLLSSAACLALLGFALSFGQAPKSAWPDVSNNDIEFTLGFAGIMATAKPDSATDRWIKLFQKEPARADRKQEVKRIRSFLRDENRWIAAHVILTWISSAPHKISDDSWAGLRIIELEGRRFAPIEGQQSKVVQFWEGKGEDM